MKQYLFMMITLVFFACGGDDGEAPSGGSEYLNVSKDITVPQGNTTTTLQISASPNLDWKISCDQQWVRFSQQSGRGAANVTVTVTANPSSAESRTAIIVVSSKSYSRECTLKQEPNAAYVDLSVTSLGFTGSASSQQFTVLSNADWIVVEPDEDWISVSPKERQQESTVVTIQVKDNPLESIRKKVFTIKGGNVSKQIEVAQAGGAKPSIAGIKQADITDITQNSAVVTFSYTSQFPVLEYGVCYSSQNSSPTLNDSHFSGTGSTLQDSKSIKISDLSPGTTYYVCAYAKSSAGIQYSNVTFFTTVSDVPGGDDNVTP